MRNPALLKTHRKDGCGRANVVDEFEDVTCLDCRPELKENRDHRFGDNSFRGYGKLKCNCGRPYVDHSIGWCPDA